MAELADATDSKPVGLTTRVGSSPTPATRPRGNPNFRVSQMPTKATPHDLRTLESIPDGTLSPDQVIPAPVDHRWQGERALMLATLEQAVSDFQRFSHAKTKRGFRLFEETQAWFLSQDAVWPLSFLNICRELDIGPERILSALRKWRDKHFIKPEESPFVRRKNHSKERGHGCEHASR